jgi:hypothetical protein
MPTDKDIVAQRQNNFRVSLESKNEFFGLKMYFFNFNPILCLLYRLHNLVIVKNNKYIIFYHGKEQLFLCFQYN